VESWKGGKDGVGVRGIGSSFPAFHIGSFSGWWIGSAEKQGRWINVESWKGGTANGGKKKRQKEETDW